MELKGEKMKTDETTEKILKELKENRPFYSQREQFAYVEGYKKALAMKEEKLFLYEYLKERMVFVPEDYDTKEAISAFKAGYSARASKDECKKHEALNKEISHHESEGKEKTK